jgi:peptide-methionine (S)-S-oxide reductase
MTQYWYKIFLLLTIIGLPMVASANQPSTEQAIFAGGCFWCMEAAFDDVPGVISAVSGYTGGQTPNPTYPQHEGHLESVQVTFDPSKISYDQLLDIFWHNIDPFNPNGQFCDIGDSYHSAIFYTNATQKAKAEATKKKFEIQFKKPIATAIRQASTFYPAEEYHQQYARKNPKRYKFYRWNCKRDDLLGKIWGQRSRL